MSHIEKFRTSCEFYQLEFRSFVVHEVYKVYKWLAFRVFGV